MIDTAELVGAINVDLGGRVDPEYRELIRRKYNVNVESFRGVRTPAVHDIAAAHYKAIKAESFRTRLELCNLLLETHVYEHKIIAFRWTHFARREFVLEHLTVFSRWLDTYIDDWTDCDDLCGQVIGEFLLKFPDSAVCVIDWAKSANRWVRRGAAVSLVLPARKGQQLALAFTVSDLLLHDDDDLVRKGYGWLLKQVSKHLPDEVFSFVMERRDTMPRVSLRYAIEKLPVEMRKKAMEK